MDRSKFRKDAAACLGQDKPVGDLVDCVTSHFPELEVYREGDDLILRGGRRFLVIRRAGPDRFRVSENVAVPSTNLVDFGHGPERPLDELIDEIGGLVNSLEI